MDVKFSAVFARLVLAVLLLGLVQPAHALGLGQARALSYLQQPLDLHIQLISRSEAEMATVTAGMASAADFRVMGLDAGVMAVPLEFTIVRDLDDPHIRVRSREPITEPVLQIVIEVVWASGRMVRQYTVFLDPPTFDSAAPLPSVTPAPVPEAPPATPPTVVEEAPVLETGPPFDPGTEPVSPVDEPAVAFESPAGSEPALAPEPVVEETPPADTPLETEVAAPPEAAVPATTEPAAAETSLVETVAAPEPEPGPEPVEPIRSALPDPGTPAADSYEVSRGETLWGLSSRWAEAHGVDVNQMMLAVQQRNPDAFNNGNINSLKAGAVLRIPQAPDDFTYDQRQAMLEVLRQEQIYRNRWDIPVDPSSLPTVSELAQQPLAEPAESAASSTADDAPDSAGRLELVPPSESADAGGETLAQGATGEAGSAGESVVEELARAEEELANARQENTYLNERILELEAEIERARAEVSDSGLAQMEDQLREDRAAGEDEPIAIVPDDMPEPWLAKYVWWLVGLLVALVAGLVWWLRTRADDSEYVDSHPLS
ncbi:hypothetical protein F3N42_07835 [Marinihelvus fidelis]|uniref:LysM domain-containing protein n=1 Tax=Marinihelvus fidelis TaxID=2613842 RepID=A0A5N0TAV7_9GAMM|nr:FimV/HubP family polar landmark protein [Marinihelvus fidelis]KAA9132070.1 hypothetical protein F3N42_07835 [Marinihelvus fidelis]